MNDLKKEFDKTMKQEMTYQEAIDKSFTTKWKIGTCSQGEQCWCRTIKPVEPILYKDGNSDDPYYIVQSGQMLKETAEYFVKLHNETFNTKEK